jgi:hypothetical protein
VQVSSLSAKMRSLPENQEVTLEESSNDKAPLVTFYQMIPTGRAPQRADRAAAGTMPVRAYRFCEAMRTASAFGWYLFPPISFSLMWDGGSDILWTFAGEDAWYPLKTAQFPGFATEFDRVAPEGMQGFSPPFLAAFKEPGIVQIWTGLIARTAPGWNLLVRPPANLARSQSYDYFEGMVETDRWFGPLFTNIRLARTNTPIEFDPQFPFLQVQPVQRAFCDEKLDEFHSLSTLAALSDVDWEAYRNTVVLPSADPNRRSGQYALTSRKRRKRTTSTGKGS